MVLLPARTGPENGSRSEVHPNGSNWVWPARTVPNLNFDFRLNLRLQTMIRNSRLITAYLGFSRLSRISPADICLPSHAASRIHFHYSTRKSLMDVRDSLATLGHECN